MATFFIRRVKTREVINRKSGAISNRKHITDEIGVYSIFTIIHSFQILTGNNFVCHRSGVPSKDFFFPVDVVKLPKHM